MSSVDLFVAMADAGADAFEVGIPYSDPMMDGPVIMRGSEAALAAGATPEVSLKIIEGVASRTGRPVLAMTYANPVMQLGWTQFTSRLAAAGAVGGIVPDLPIEESQPLAQACAEKGLGLVQFVSPMSSTKRIQQVAATDPAFIYGVADMGVTGERSTVSPHVESLSQRVRGVTPIPLVFGVGISTPDQARAVRSLAEGVIVGTAMVRRVLEARNATEAARSLHQAVKELVAALR
jgi:tryptophan synthase alpha chain